MIYLCAMFSPRLLDTPDRTPTGFRPTLTLPVAPAARPERANPRGGSSRQRVVGTRPLFVVLVPRDRSPRTRPGRPKSDVSLGAASGTLHGRVTGPRGRTPQQCKDRSVFLLRPTVANTPSTDAFHSGCTALPAAHRASQCCTRMVSTACFVASELRVLPTVTTVDAMGPSVIEQPNTDTIATPVLFLVSGIGLQLRMSVVAVPGCWPGLWVEPVGRAPTSGGCVCLVPWQGGGGGQGDEPTVPPRPPNMVWRRS